MSGDTEVRVFVCDHCGAAKWNAWPHPEGEACAFKTNQEIRADEIHAAYLEKVHAERDAQIAMRDYYLRMQMSGLDMSEIARILSRMLGEEADD